MKKIIASIILILSVFLSGCNTKVNNLELLENKGCDLKSSLAENSKESSTVKINSKYINFKGNVFTMWGTLF